MLHYRYDGDFDGLLCVVFEAYPNRDRIAKVTAQPEQMSLAFEEIFVPTDPQKARRVEKYIREQISRQFLHDVRACFLSWRPEKDTVLVRTIFKAMKVGEKIMDIFDEDVMLMAKIIKQVLGERHRYLGLVRFREMTDKTLIATIEPKNNILPIIMSHFQDRLPHERFAIFDKKRGMLAYYDGQMTELFFTDNIQTDWSDEERMFSDLWKIFHRSISIEERKNKKRQKSHLPKYYWKHLVEDMEM